MTQIDPISSRAVWDFLWYTGIAGAMLTLIVLIVRGHLVPQVHHLWVISALTKDRDEWCTHAKELEELLAKLQGHIEHLVEQLREQRGRR